MHAQQDSEPDATEQARPQTLGPSDVSRKLSAVHAGRNSIGIDIDPQYCRFALHRLDAESGPLFGHAGIEYRKAGDLLAGSAVTAVAEGMKNKDRGMRSNTRKSRRRD
jgi:hypothetical protein